MKFKFNQNDQQQSSYGFDSNDRCNQQDIDKNHKLHYWSLVVHKYHRFDTDQEYNHRVFLFERVMNIIIERFSHFLTNQFTVGSRIT